MRTRKEPNCSSSIRPGEPFWAQKICFSEKLFHRTGAIKQFGKKLCLLYVKSMQSKKTSEEFPIINNVKLTYFHG